MSLTDNQFEKDKISYEQHSESFRHLNSQMWQVPIIAMTLTGGLWFGVFSSTTINDFVSGGLLIFCGVCDFLFVFILFRVHFIMSLLIEKLNIFNPSYSIDPTNTTNGNALIRKDNLVITLFSSMLIFATILSFLTASYKFWPCLFN